jgi:hypothetical protein
MGQGATLLLFLLLMRFPFWGTDGFPWPDCARATPGPVAVEQLC